MTPQDVWDQVADFMVNGDIFKNNEAFELIFRSGAEIALRNELQCYLHSNKSGWFSVPEYKMKNINSLNSHHRKAGDLAVFEKVLNLCNHAPPGCIIESKHYSSLQTPIESRKTNSNEIKLSLPMTCFKELCRWGDTPVLHLTFFTIIDSLINNLGKPLGYSLLESYVRKSNAKYGSPRDIDSLWTHFVASLDRKEVPDIDNEMRGLPPISKVPTTPAISKVPTTPAPIFLPNSNLCIAVAKSPNQNIKVNGIPVDGCIYVIGVWKCSDVNDANKKDYERLQSELNGN